MTTEIVKSENAKTELEIPALVHFGTLQVKEKSLRMGNLEAMCVVKKLVHKTHYSDIMGKRMLSPAGADFLNEVAGLEFQEVKEDSFEEHDANGFVRVKKTGMMVGLTMFGKKVVVGPLTLSLSPQAYFMRGLAKEATYCIGSQKRYCFWGNAKSKMPYESDGWIYYPDSEHEGIWADGNTKEISKARETRAQDRLYADRRLLGILKRNLFCMHPGGAPMYPQSDLVPMVVWRPAADAKQDNNALMSEALRIANAPNARDAINAEWTEAPMTDDAMVMDGADDIIDDRDADAPVEPNF